MTSTIHYIHTQSLYTQYAHTPTLPKGRQIVPFGCSWRIQTTLYSTSSTKHKHFPESLHLHWVTFLYPQSIKIFNGFEYIVWQHSKRDDPPTHTHTHPTLEQGIDSVVSWGVSALNYNGQLLN